MSAIRTISLRLRGTSTKELEEAGEDTTGVVTSKSKLRSKIKSLSGVDILTDTGAYKSTYEILLEISKVWKDMSDIDQAALLEIIAGKTRSNTAAAILSNTTDLENAYVDALNAEGSALEENEKYLDSIQGRIDRFNNAVQTMWSNTLDDAWIKGFVEFGTILVKIIDGLGLINTLLIGISTYAMIKNKMGPITFFKELIGLIPKGVRGIQTWVQNLQFNTKETEANTAANIKNAASNVADSKTEDKNTADTVENTVATKADTEITEENTAANIANATSSVASGEAEDKDTADTIENITATKADTEITKENTTANIANTGSNVASGTGEAGKIAGSAIGAKGIKGLLSKLGMSGASSAAGGASAFTGLAAAVPYILGAIAAIAAGVIIFKAVTTDINELKEELQESQSEFNNTKSEIDSINSELETTQERIAELLAKPSLSFVEQEELKKLQQQNALLERNLKLQEMILAQKEAKVTADTQKYLSATWDGSKWYDKPYTVNGVTGVISEDKWYTRGVSAKEALDIAIDKYVETKQTRDALSALALEWDDNSSDGNAELISRLGLDSLVYAGADDKEYVLEQQKAYDAALVNIASGISSVLDNPQYSGLSYGMTPEIDAFLDEWNAYQYKFQEAQGLGGKSSAIASIFDDTASDSIKKLKEDLTEIADDDTLDTAQKQVNALNLVNEAINNTTGSYDRLKTSMDIIGITADEVARYFVQLSEAPDSSTVEGLTSQYQKGINILKQYKGNVDDIIAEFTNLDGTVEKITWGSLFDNEGNVIETQIAKVLQGADETARNKFARLVKQINEGNINVEQAMKSFGASGIISVAQLIESQISEINTDVFKDLGDELSGVIDTFKEFSSALESTASSMELLDAAQTQMANSGRISVKTALELMQSTDNWNELLEIENGNIRLVNNAEEILIQTKLDLIKKNLEAALATVEAQLAEITATETSSDLAYTIEESTNLAVTQLAGNMAYLTEMMKAYTRAANGEVVDMNQAMLDAEAAKNKVLSDTDYKKNAAEKIGTEELEKKKKEIEAMLEMYEGIDTSSEFKNYYDYDKTPGDKYKDDSKSDAFQKEMDYWDNRIAANQAKYEQVQNEIDLLEKRGKKANKEFYEEQIALEEARRELLEGKDGLGGKKGEALKYLKELEKAGKEGSDEWWEATKVLNDVESEIDDVTSSIQDLRDAIAEIDLYIFEETHNRFKNLIDDLETVRDLIAPNGEEDWFDDDGMWTSKGVSVLGTYIQQYEMYKNALAGVNEELAKYQKEYKGNEAYYKKFGIDSEAELYERQRELIDQQKEYRVAISDTEISVKDMYESQIDAIEEWANTAIDAYNDYIDVVKEALSAERDLYNFKKSTTEKTKSIAALERRIASLAGSDNAADIAERKKLQAELTDAKTDLEDHYYEHSMDAREQALDDEAQAYEYSLNNYIEKLRLTLDEATENMELFMQSVTSAVMLNAGTVKDEYIATGIVLDEALVSPWDKAIAEIKGFEKDGLSMMNAWTTEEGFFGKFESNATEQLKSPWAAGTTAAQSFQTDVKTAMEGVESAVRSNVTTAKELLDSLSGRVSEVYQQIKDTEKQVSNLNSGNGGNGGNGGNNGNNNNGYTNNNNNNNVSDFNADDVKMLQQILQKVFGINVNITGSYDATTKAGVQMMQSLLKNTGHYTGSVDGLYGAGTYAALSQYVNSNIRQASLPSDKREGWFNGNAVSFFRNRSSYIPSALYTNKTNKTKSGGGGGKGTYTQVARYATGTTGTKKNQLALTDEPEFGDELTLVPGKDGNLSFMRRGTGVVPADLTKKLFELAQMPTNELMNTNIMKPLVTNVETKNQAVQINFESLVKADNITNDVLPEVEKMVSKQLDAFTKKLNYAIKRL